MILVQVSTINDFIKSCVCNLSLDLATNSKSKASMYMLNYFHESIEKHRSIDMSYA